MKKVAGILFVIGMMFGLLDVDTMSVFLLTKVIAIACFIPAYLILREE